MSGHRVDDVALRARRDLREIAGGGRRAIMIANREPDFDCRGQIAGPRHRIARGADDVADRCRGRLAFALCEPQQRKPGLWLASMLAGLAIRFLGGVELAAQPQQLATLVADTGRFARRGVVPGAPDFLHGLLPRALDEKDLRSKRAAGAAEFHQLWLSVAPRGQRRAPF